MLFLYFLKDFCNHKIPFISGCVVCFQLVDNIPILQIDMVWCYFMLRDIAWLSMAGIRLEKARQGLERAHGKDSSRFRLLQAGRSSELALWVFISHYLCIFKIRTGCLILVGNCIFVDIWDWSCWKEWWHTIVASLTSVGGVWPLHKQNSCRLDIMYLLLVSLHLSPNPPLSLIC